MAILEKARIRETTTTTGTGSLTLNGVRYRNDQTFINGIGAGNQTFYYLLDGNGVDWEAGLGTVSTPSVLSRDIVYESSNNGGLIDLSVNVHMVFCGRIPGHMTAFDMHGQNISNCPNIDNKLPIPTQITPSTNTKITYDANGLITGSAQAQINDIGGFNSTSPVAGQVLVYNGTQYINDYNQVLAPGAGINQFLTATSAGITGVDLMTKEPDSSPEVDEQVTVTSGTSPLLGYSYLSQDAIGYTQIPGGAWLLNMFCYASTNAGTTTATLTFKLYHADTTETTLFSVTTPHITWTSIELVPNFSSVQQAFSCAETDRLKVDIYLSTTHTSPVTFHLIHSGTAHYSHWVTPIAVTHNQLPGLQGGNSAERYHLTLAQLNNIASAASGTQNGYLSSADWAVFNAKEPAITASTTAKYWRGDKTFQTLDTSVVPAVTNKNYVTDAQLTVIGNTSGTNTGNETTTTIGALINGATDKPTPVDADYVGVMDSAASNILKKWSWANIKATLKAYFDTLYASLSGATFDGAVIFGDQAVTRANVADCGITVYAKGTINSTSTVTFDHTQGHIQSFTCGGAYTLTWAFSNWPPTTNRGYILVKATNMGLGTLAFSGTVNWKQKNDTYTTTFATYLSDRGGETALKSAGLDEFLFWTDDAGTTVYGCLL